MGADLQILAVLLLLGFGAAVVRWGRLGLDAIISLFYRSGILVKSFFQMARWSNRPVLLLLLAMLMIFAAWSILLFTNVPSEPYSSAWRHLL